MFSLSHFRICALVVGLVVFVAAGFAPSPDAAPPPDHIAVISISNASEVKAPFLIRQDPSAAGGQALYLPEGAGTKVLEYEDPDPITVERIGLGGYDSRMNFSHVEIRTLPD